MVIVGTFDEFFVCSGSSSCFLFVVGQKCWNATVLRRFLKRDVFGNTEATEIFLLYFTSFQSLRGFQVPRKTRVLRRFSVYLFSKSPFFVP